MVEYHDSAWGVPAHDDLRHFEFLVLEAAQAGLSWDTILRRREGYGRAFADFDPAKVARFDTRRVERLMKDPTIVRNRLKIEGAITNAKRFLEVQREFGSFDAYVWRFAPRARAAPRQLSDIPVRTPEAEALSKDLRKRGFTFVGPVMVYAYMEAVGLVNDHVAGCFRRSEIRALG